MWRSKNIAANLTQFSESHDTREATLGLYGSKYVLTITYSVGNPQSSIYVAVSILT